MSAPRRHLHPIYDLAERALEGGAHRRSMDYNREAPSLSTHASVGLVLRLASFVVDRQIHRLGRQVSLAYLRWHLERHEGVGGDAYEPRGDISPIARDATRLAAHTDDPDFHREVLTFVRQTVGIVLDAPELLRFLAAEVLRGELATLGLQLPEPARFVGALPVFRGPGAWIVRAASGELLLLRRHGDSLVLVDGSDDDVLASVPDGSFAEAVAVLRATPA